MRWEEVYFEIFVYKSNLSQIETSTFPCVQSSGKIYLNKGKTLSQGSGKII